MSFADDVRPQAEAFEKHLPSTDPEDALAFLNAHGQIVSISARKALPNGIVLSLATERETFGPMHLTQIASEQLLSVLAQVVTQHYRM